jgi:hypothetical protein
MMLVDGVEVAELLWHRRHALQIAMQLPEDKAHALIILEAARKLVTDYLGEDTPRLEEDRPLALEPETPREPAVVVMFPNGTSASADVKR